MIMSMSGKAPWEKQARETAEVVVDEDEDAVVGEVAVTKVSSIKTHHGPHYFCFERYSTVAGDHRQPVSQSKGI